jgi:predicted outer membrane repeat protein
MKSEKNHLKEYIVCLLAITWLLWSSLAFGDVIGVPDDYGTIQDALNAAATGDEVVVADNKEEEVYTGEGNVFIDFGGKAIVLRSENGPKDCVIDGGGVVSPVFWFITGETADAQVIGFTIRNGQFFSGGAVFCHKSSPTFRECIFQNNSVSNYGGAVYCNEGSPTFINCTFDANFADKLGGAVASVTPLSSINTASPTFINCVMTRNWATSGGAMYLQNSYGNLVDCTLRDNTAGSGAGVYCNRAYPTVVNSILWNFSSSGVEEISFNPGSEPQVVYSDVKGGWVGEGNIEEDPLFVPSGDLNLDVHLSEGSPCIDAGTSTVELLGLDVELPEFDFEGDERNLGQGPDMGADETPAKSLTPLDIAIDIKPGGDGNRINLKSRGVVPVAVLTTETFNALDIVFGTVEFAKTEALRGSVEDVDRDGDADVVFHFRTRDLVLDKGSTEATLSGMLIDKTEFSGTDKVRIVPARRGKAKGKGKAKGRAPCHCPLRLGHRK